MDKDRIYRDLVATEANVSASKMLEVSTDNTGAWPNTFRISIKDEVLTVTFAEGFSKRYEMDGTYSNVEVCTASRRVFGINIVKRKKRRHELTEIQEKNNGNS